MCLNLIMMHVVCGAMHHAPTVHAKMRSTVADLGLARDLSWWLCCAFLLKSFEKIRSVYLANGAHTTRQHYNDKKRIL